MNIDVTDFYPRSPCGERPSIAGLITSNGTFLSTLSLRRATLLNSSWISSIRNFYPRSPCGERHQATSNQPEQQEISIHALLAESDGA